MVNITNTSDLKVLRVFKPSLKKGRKPNTQFCRGLSKN